LSDAFKQWHRQGKPVLGSGATREKKPYRYRKTNEAAVKAEIDPAHGMEQITIKRCCKLHTQPLICILDQ